MKKLPVTKENNVRKSLLTSVQAVTALFIASGLALFASHDVLAKGKSHVSFSAVDMVILGPNEVVLGPALGASTLIRDKKGATGTVHVGDLGNDSSVLDTRGTTVYSVWAIVFNNPTECERTQVICSPGEEIMKDGGVAAGLSIFWVAGGISSSNTDVTAGVLNLEFRIERKRPPGFVIPDFSQDGLTNVAGAEIHFVVAPHPDAMPGNVAFELTHPGPAIRGAAHLP